LGHGVGGDTFGILYGVAPEVGILLGYFTGVAPEVGYFWDTFKTTL
jgi:hypothetical protein